MKCYRRSKRSFSLFILIEAKSAVKYNRGFGISFWLGYRLLSALNTLWLHNWFILWNLCIIEILTFIISIGQNWKRFILVKYRRSTTTLLPSRWSSYLHFWLQPYVVVSQRHILLTLADNCFPVQKWPPCNFSFIKP